MHEWALAEAVLETVRRHAEERKAPKVRSVTISFGELQRVDREVFREGLRVLLEREEFGEEVFSFEEEPATFRCTACGREWGFADLPDMGEDEKEAIHFMPEAAHVYMRCPACGSPDFRVEGGRGVSIRAMELERAEGPAAGAEA